jgi:hypothetical protein
MFERCKTQVLMTLWYNRVKFWKTFVACEVLRSVSVLFYSFFRINCASTGQFVNILGKLVFSYFLYMGRAGIHIIFISDTSVLYQMAQLF